MPKEITLAEYIKSNHVWELLSMLRNNCGITVEGGRIADKLANCRKLSTKEDIQNLAAFLDAETNTDFKNGEPIRMELMTRLFQALTPPVASGPFTMSTIMQAMVEEEAENMADEINKRGFLAQLEFIRARNASMQHWLKEAILKIT